MITHDSDSFVMELSGWKAKHLQCCCDVIGLQNV